MIDRRSFIQGIIAAPAIVRAASLMPIRGIIQATDDLYGISPAMYALPFVRDWNEYLDTRAVVAEMVRSMHLPVQYLR